MGGRTGLLRDGHELYTSHVITMAHEINHTRARTWRWSTSQIPVDFDFWLVDLAHLLAILAS